MKKNQTTVNSQQPAKYKSALESIERQKTLLAVARLHLDDFNRTWETITEKTTPVLDADRTSIWSLSSDGSKLICEDLFIASTNSHSSRLELVCANYPSYFRALETSRFIDASDGANDPRTAEFTDTYLNPLNIKSLLDVPVLFEGKLSGVVCFEYMDNIHTWTLEEKEFAASLADLVSAKFESRERNLVEKGLEEAKKRAEESDRLKTSLLANMSHELRTPMNSILGFSELLMNDTDDPGIQSFGKKIHNAGRRLMNTLQAILELADMETTRSKLALKEVDVVDVLSSVLPPFQSLASEKGLYLLPEFTSRTTANADENLLKLVFQNLIDNAIKFSESGGVTIETAHGKREGKECTLVIFKDTGIGIDSADFNRIFEEFRQASEGYARRYEGTGLGLTLSSKMLRLMGGSITVESVVGEGSVFTVFLPAYSSDEKQEKRPEPVSAGIGIQHELPLVLIVEDNEDNAEIVKLYLKSRFRLDRAQDGNTALKMIENKQYKIVLLDINLGVGMDGLRIVQTMRQKEDYHDIPIIAITGYTMGEDYRKIMEAGCSHYVAKPFTKSVLVQVMENALAPVSKS